MTSKVLLKKSSVTAKIPLTADLEYGELALNYTDEKLYFKNSANEVKAFSTGGAGASTSLDFQSYVATAGQTVFAVAYTAPFVTVSINGATLNPADYTATTGTNITLSTAAVLSDVVTLQGFSSLSVGEGGGTSLPTQSGNSGKYLSTDGTTASWQTVAGGTGGTVDLTAVAQNILPSVDITYDLGSTDKRWRDLYLSGSTINLGGAVIKADATTGSIALLPKPTVEEPNPTGIVVSATGGISTVVSVGGEISTENFVAATAVATAAVAAAATASATSDSFTGNGTQTTFTLTATPASKYWTIVNYNGILLLHDDYDISGNSLILSSAPVTNSKIEITTFSQLGGINATSVAKSVGYSLVFGL